MGQYCCPNQRFPLEFLHARPCRSSGRRACRFGLSFHFRGARGARLSGIDAAVANVHPVVGFGGSRWAALFLRSREILTGPGAATFRCETTTSERSSLEIVDSGWDGDRAVADLLRLGYRARCPVSLVLIKSAIKNSHWWVGREFQKECLDQQPRPHVSRRRRSRSGPRSRGKSLSSTYALSITSIGWVSARTG